MYIRLVQVKQHIFMSASVYFDHCGYRCYKQNGVVVYDTLVRDWSHAKGSPHISDQFLYQEIR